jgi:hypothetical protein
MNRKKYALALICCCSAGMLWSQSAAMDRMRSLPPRESVQHVPIAVLPPMSDFERFSGDHFGHPLVELTFPTVTIDAGSTSLKLTPRSRTLFDEPNGPKAFAVLLNISRNARASSPGDAEHYSTQAQSLTTYLDDDELSEFVSLLRKLAATGVPPPPTLMPNAKVAVSLIVESGTRFGFTPEASAVIRCEASNDADTVEFVISAERMNTIADTFWTVKQNLHTARESLR